jgi:tRNA threonylcarbamoyladenosine biosynthesis protein TsaE
MAADASAAGPSIEVALPDAAATDRLGRWLGAHLAAGDAVGLVGDLGAGKTSLVRGMAHGLRLDDPEAISSPTYLLVVDHGGPVRLLHADAYLPAKLQGFLTDGGLEYLFEPAAVAVVEWADRIRNLMPGKTLWVELASDAAGGRRVTLRSAAVGAFPWLANVPKMP